MTEPINPEPRIGHGMFVTDRLAVSSAFPRVFEQARREIAVWRDTGISHVVFTSDIDDFWPSLLAEIAPDVAVISSGHYEPEDLHIPRVDGQGLLDLYRAPSSRLLLISPSGSSPGATAWALLVGDGSDPLQALQSLCQAWPRTAWAMNPDSVPGILAAAGVPDTSIDELTDRLFDYVYDVQDNMGEADDIFTSTPPEAGWIIHADGQIAEIITAEQNELPTELDFGAGATPAYGDPVFLYRTMSEQPGLVGCGVVVSPGSGARPEVAVDGFGDTPLIEPRLLAQALGQDPGTPAAGRPIKLTGHQALALDQLWIDLVDDEIMSIPPASAWLLMGSQSSLPTEEAFTAGETAAMWTASPRTRPGDLLFFYFVAPLSAICYVARAISYPEFRGDIEVVADSRVDNHQWWVEISEMIPITPIAHGRLQELTGGMVLRGRSGLYLRPDQAGALIAAIGDSKDQLPELKRVLVVPVGPAEVPDPTRMDLQAWASLAAGALEVEAQVETHVVEPLLRFTLGGDPSISWQRQLPIPGAGAKGDTGYADYVIVKDERVLAVIEVKQGVQGAGDWADSLDLAQTMRYSRHLSGVPAMLIDANRIFLIDPGGRSPSHQFDRAEVTHKELTTIADHLRGYALEDFSLRGRSPGVRRNTRRARNPGGEGAGTLI